jgi:hypothetical protein
MFNSLRIIFPPKNLMRPIDVCRSRTPKKHHSVRPLCKWYHNSTDELELWLNGCTIEWFEYLVEQLWFEYQTAESIQIQRGKTLCSISMAYPRWMGTWSRLESSNLGISSEYIRHTMSHILYSVHLMPLVQNFSQEEFTKLSNTYYNIISKHHRKECRDDGSPNEAFQDVMPPGQTSPWKRTICRYFFSLNG